jgi:hypothetical protein
MPATEAGPGYCYNSAAGAPLDIRQSLAYIRLRIRSRAWPAPAAQNEHCCDALVIPKGRFPWVKRLKHLGMSPHHDDIERIYWI